ncbi:hypothetical protein NY551_18855 [Curtobacterium flaccumfaciens pv. oortii]|uniref:hypothetical protein n=1 Tax=Curtobacterium flaccumfaciens TaxID=2035 RepID=UPI002657F854|nr:hypothetical protein [Curtobacterium flaccumfaciens]MCS5524800.1 hypothetical protein [Curtobacterium flaccumfaciens pv. oortii]
MTANTSLAHRARHWLGVPAPEELGDPSTVPPGTVRVDALGRPFQAARRGRRQPNEWSRRWFETPEDTKRRERWSRRFLLTTGLYLGTLIGIYLVAVVEGWNGPAVSPLTLILPVVVITVIDRLWHAMTVPAPATSDRSAPPS